MLNQRVLCNLLRFSRKLIGVRELSTIKTHQFSLDSEFFANYVPDEKTIDEIADAAKIRKCRGSIDLLRHYFKAYHSESDNKKKSEFRLKLIDELKKFPNQTHPAVLDYGVDVEKIELDSFGDLHKKPIAKAYSCMELGVMSNTIRMSDLGTFCGSKSYYFMNSVAELETALIRYTTDILLKKGFEIISVPDILPAKLIEACGQQVDGHPTQVYRLKSSDLCLSGTSEMALAGYLSGKTFSADELPKKVMATSRCFRAEAAGSSEERNLYRVHTFTKVEMFAACLPSQSDALLEEFREIQVQLFKGLGLCFKVYDMPVNDLGLPAYRKYDIEAWMPSRNDFGEISSTSNCTDYQSKRLNIYYQDGTQKMHAHTVNGTACAIPRMIIALLEQYQTQRSVKVPTALQPYMGGVEELRTSVAVPRTMLVHNFDQNALTE